MQKTIPLNQLRFGHEAVPPINARKLGRDQEIAPLKASIKAHGLGQGLNVREIDGTPYVADGNRRLLALRGLAQDGDIAPDAPIDCNVGADGDAAELSLALNIQRLPMHEADQYEKFQEMRTAGMTDEQIGARFGIEPARVRRMVALGRLHPVILDAWRNDEFNRPVDVVRAFTMAPSQKAQKEVFEQLKKKGWLDPYRIREAFGAGNDDAVRLLRFVGREVYEEAGGKVTEDLFGDNHAISDYDLVQKLANDRLAHESEQLRSEGWSWVELADDLPSHWSYSWGKIRPKLVDPTEDESIEIKKLEKVLGKTQRWDRNEAQQEAAWRLEEINEAITVRSFTAKHKADSGVALAIDREGHLSVTYGVEKPKPVKADPAKKGDAATPAIISTAMMNRLSVQLTAAAKDAITANPHTALAAVIAGLMTSGYGHPVVVRAEGILRNGRDNKESFQDMLVRLVATPLDDLLVMLAHEAGQMLNLQSNHNTQPPLAREIFSSFVEVLEPGALQEALRKRFDAEDYFKTVPKSFAIAAIAEAINPDEARKAETLKKGELVKLAVQSVPPTGWLPPELRTSTYAGPKAPAPEPEKKTS